MFWMKVSIITVCYNSESTVSRTIKSVLEQAYTNIEYIVIDGDSEDNTVAKVEQFESEISYFISEKDNGIYDAMNKGIRLATGDIIGILNSDDLFYDNNVLTNVVKAFEESNADCVYGNIVYFKKNIQDINRVWKTRAFYDGFFESGEMPPHPALFVKKRVYDEIGLFRTDFKVAADLEFMIRMLRKNKFTSYFVNQFFVRMRLGGASTSGVRSYLLSTKEIKKAWSVNSFHYPYWLYILRPIIKIRQLRFQISNLRLFAKSKNGI